MRPLQTMSLPLPTSPTPPTFPAPPSPARAALWLFLGVFCAYALAASMNHAGYERETVEQARSLPRGGIPKGRAGLFDVLIYVPFVAVAEVLSSLAAAPLFREFIPNLALAAAMAATVALVFLIALELFRPRAALGTALVFAFTTMAWPYSKMGMETGLTLASTLAFYGLALAARGSAQLAGEGAAGASGIERGQRSELGWAIYAVGLGCLLFTKTHAPVVIFLFLVCGAWLVRRGAARRPSRRALTRAFASLAAIAVVWVLTNHARHGAWLISSSYSAKWEAARTPGYFLRLAGLILSPGKSILLYNPSLIVALALAPAMARRSPVFFAALVFVVIPQFFFHAWFRTWADETWGPRRLMNVIPILILPVGVALEAMGSESEGKLGAFGKIAARAIVGAALLAGFLFQFLAVSINYASVVWTLQAAGLATQRNMAWRPATSAPRVELRIARSMIRRARDRGSLEMHLPARFVGLRDFEYLPWNAPELAPQQSLDAFIGTDPSRRWIRLDLAPFDRAPDFWWAQRRVQFPDRPPWRDKPLWFVPILILGAGAGFVFAARASRAPRPLPAPR